MTLGPYLYGSLASTIVVYYKLINKLVTLQVSIGDAMSKPTLAMIVHRNEAAVDELTKNKQK